MYESRHPLCAVYIFIHVLFVLAVFVLCWYECNLEYFGGNRIFWSFDQVKIAMFLIFLEVFTYFAFR